MQMQLGLNSLKAQPFKSDKNRCLCINRFNEMQTKFQHSGQRIGSIHLKHAKGNANVQKDRDCWVYIHICMYPPICSI